MMRRRALLAASQTGGGDAPEFPLYLYFDYCEELSFMKICYRAADDVGKTYFSYLWRALSAYGFYNGYSYILPNDTLEDLGIFIHLDGDRIIEISSTLDPEHQAIEFATSSSPHGIWLVNGKIEQEF